MAPNKKVYGQIKAVGRSAKMLHQPLNSFKAKQWIKSNLYIHPEGGWDLHPTISQLFYAKPWMVWCWVLLCVFADCLSGLHKKIQKAHMLMKRWATVWLKARMQKPLGKQQATVTFVLIRYLSVLATLNFYNQLGRKPTWYFVETWWIRAAGAEAHQHFEQPCILFASKTMKLDVIGRRLSKINLVWCGCPGLRAQEQLI